MKLSELRNYENNKDYLREIKDHKRNVVPFIGAGVSRGCGLYSWNELLVKIAIEYFTKKEIKELNKLSSIEFADRIVERAGNTPMVMRKIRQIFADAEIKYTAVPYILLEEFSPLLVTTNYDSIIENVSKDCSRGEIKSLLPCLQGQFVDAIQLNEYKLLKIHGSIEEISSFVFSSEQYDIAYEENGLVKRYLHSIFNGKRVLFVGCSLVEDKTMDVLKECIKSNQNLAHFAILPRPKANAEYLRRNSQLTKLGIFPIYYPEGDFDALEKLLNYIADNNRFVHAMKLFIKEVIGDYSHDNVDILYSIMSNSFYKTGNKFNSILDIDYSHIDINEYMRNIAVVLLRDNFDLSLKDICIYGFIAYLYLGGIENQDSIIRFFENVFTNQLLEETEIVQYLKKEAFSHKKMIDVWDGMQLVQLTDQQINSLAQRQIGILKYKGGMSFDEIEADYRLGERIIDYCSNKLTLANRINLLKGVGTFGFYFPNLKKSREYLVECVKLVCLSGLDDDNQKKFLAETYNNLALIEARDNNNIKDALYYNELDIKIKNSIGITGLSIRKSLDFRATLLKELNPFEALVLYLEISKAKEDCYKKDNSDESLISWLTTIFNIGLVAKDLRLYQEAYRIISKVNKTRLKILEKSNKDYCSSVNVECELEILLGREITNSDLLRAIECRTELPDGFLETKDHTWYVCALYFYSKKKYREAVSYINKAKIVNNRNNVIHDLRQEVRSQVLLADARYEIIKEKKGCFDSIEELYCNAVSKIHYYYGTESIYLMEIYEHLWKRFGTKYEEKYRSLNSLYGEKIEQAKATLQSFDFIINEV